MARLVYSRGQSTFDAYSERTDRHQVVKTDKHDRATLAAPLGHMPVHIISGSALLIYREPKQTLTETRKGPFALIVSLDNEGRAKGEAIVDDGITIGGELCDWKRVRTHRPGLSKTLSFRVEDRKLYISATGDFAVPNYLTRLIVLGMDARPTAVEAQGISVEDLQWQGNVGTLTVGGFSIELDGEVTVSW